MGRCFFDHGYECRAVSPTADLRARAGACWRRTWPRSVSVGFVLPAALELRHGWCWVSIVRTCSQRSPKASQRLAPRRHDQSARLAEVAQARRRSWQCSSVLNSIRASPCVPVRDGAYLVGSATAWFRDSDWSNGSANGSCQSRSVRGESSPGCGVSDRLGRPRTRAGRVRRCGMGPKTTPAGRWARPGGMNMREPSGVVYQLEVSISLPPTSMPKRPPRVQR
jgi:hypothetical protein